MLSERVQEIVGLFWDGNAKAAAKQLGIPQNTLYRIVSGETPNPRANVLATIAKFAGTTVEYLLTGEGQGPQLIDPRGRRVSGGSHRWFRAVTALFPSNCGVREALDGVPFGPTGFLALVLRDVDGHPTGAATSQRRLDIYNRVQATCAEAWAELLEAAIKAYGADAVREKLESAELAVAGGFTSFAMFLANGPMPKAEAERSFSAWTDQFTQGDGSPE